jgi:hypothetical protein
VAAGDVQGTSSSGRGDEDSVENEMGSWLYIDVFNGGAELGDADLRYVVELDGDQGPVAVLAVSVCC